MLIVVPPYCDLLTRRVQAGEDEVKVVGNCCNCVVLVGYVTSFK
jgi:hypothetical protein